MEDERLNDGWATMDDGSIVCPLESKSASSSSCRMDGWCICDGRRGCDGMSEQFGVEVGVGEFLSILC